MTTVCNVGNLRNMDLRVEALEKVMEVAYIVSYEEWDLHRIV